MDKGKLEDMTGEVIKIDCREVTCEVVT